MADTNNKNKESLDEKRIESRQAYLPKREFQKLRELKDEIEDEAEMFQDNELTAKEKEDLQQKVEIYNLAKQRIATDQINAPQYVIPTTKGVVEKQNFDTKDDDTEWLETRAKAAVTGKTLDDRKGDNFNEFEKMLDEENVDDFEQKILQMRAAELDAPSKRTKVDELSEVRKTLPVYKKRDEFLKLLRSHQIIIIAGETGSGKTTQLPQYLFEEGYCKTGKIAVTQPRRVAAMSVARRVAEEVGCRLGGLVGYTIRFDDVTSDRTLIQYMTDGMLLRAFLNAPDLKEYSCIMIDEAHERTVATDILFGLLKDVARFREDLKIIISSATLETQKFSEYFDNAPVFLVPGRRFPVTIEYLKEPEPDPLLASVLTTLKIHTTMPKGDVLIFLTGQEEVEQCVEMLKERTRGLGTKIDELIITKIYSALPSDIQAQIFAQTPPNARKVVVATNIAETSLTVDGIVYVIDCGYCKINEYNSRTGMESLLVTPISKASADQRAGRAGRVSPGVCYRLYTKEAFIKELPAATPPEIVRSNLSAVILLLKTLGIDDIVHFDFMDPPSPESMMRALEELYGLGAFNQNGELTLRGRKMAEFPMAPSLARVIISAEGFGCTEEIATICAMLQVSGELFYRPKEKAQLADTAKKSFVRGEGDHITLLTVFNSWIEAGRSDGWCRDNFIQARALNRAEDIRDQIVNLMERVDIQLIKAKDYASIIKSLLSGFFFNTAQLTKEGVYRQVRQNRTIEIHPSSVLYGKSPRWILFYELVMTTKEYVRQVSEIDPAWLVEIAPHIFKEADMKEAIRKYRLKKK
ncbi:ATP-dependent RNA helicase, putative [Entamoeba invadens IP1]|uniref:RNA helicase n=1 Tax=Entamoeba invadens IP1 TaxID=370355 RepID=A0A0A1TWN0_ENTIV|nr:ATP-dependent RNA helicase, putative [Entamoeba invadens IP1]ELP85592.1 ATP-dependent RNA helicase, putative [Entamoeba invadens IP1]|eukprot:XP_004184938.1 ATP-dependent RNA helicase, putative [Entamoeba invadens IP1]